MLTAGIITCSLSIFLRSIPARESEESARYELDPMSLGQVVLCTFSLILYSTLLENC